MTPAPPSDHIHLFRDGGTSRIQATVSQSEMQIKMAKSVNDGNS